MTLCGQTRTHVPHSQQLPYATTSFIICRKVGRPCAGAVMPARTLAAAFSWCQLTPRWYRRRVLPETEMRALRAIADALVPAGGPFALGASDVGTADRLAGYLARMPAATRAQLRLLLRAWDASPLASRYARRFSRLSPADQRTWLERSAESRAMWRRLPVVLLKTLCVAAFCAD